MDTPHPPAASPKAPEASSKDGYGFLALALVALASGLALWAYFDAASRDLEREMAYLEANVAGLAEQSRPPVVASEGEGKMRPPTPEGWQTADGGAYLIDLPPGFALRVGEDGYDAVHSEPLRDDDLAPYAVIRELPASREAEYAEAGGRLLIAGDVMYWMHLYENLEWKDFDLAASTLRLK